MVRLGDLRRAANLTQAELANRSNLSEQTIYKLEAGLHEPSMSALRRLTEVLGDGVLSAAFGWKREVKQRGRPRKDGKVGEEIRS